MSPEAIDALVAAGATAEMLAAAWKAEIAAAPPPAARSAGAERQARYRQRMRNEASQGDAGDVTGDAGDATPSLDKESLPQTPSKKLNLSRERDARATRLPDNWERKPLTEGSVSREVADRRGAAWMRKTLELFENHWRSVSGKRGIRTDWQKTWANWVIEQDQRDGRHGQRGGQQASQSGHGTTVDAALAFIADDGPG